MSVEPTRYGTYQARWRVDGEQHSKTFKRKVDAIAFEKDTLLALERGVYLPPKTGTVLVADMADRWLAGARDLGQGGKETYRRDLDRYVLPALGQLPLRRLTVDAIDDYLSAELAHGLAPSTVHRHYRTLNRLCNVAIEKGQLHVNPCGKVTPPRVEHTEMRFLTADQVEALAAAMPDRYRAWIHTAVYAGPRWSELRGLRRSSIAATKITIMWQLVKRVDGDSWDRPKTKAGRRVVNIDKVLADELAEHIDRWALPGADGLVFPNRRGVPLSSPTFTNSTFKPALERAGLDRAVRIHDLRHTAVALAIKAGAHPKAIQSRMGHASIMVTLDRYGHLYDEMDIELADRLGTLRAADRREDGV